MPTGNTGTAGRRRGFSGSSKSAYGSAILGAPFWKPGTEVAGAFIGTFETANGTCYKFRALPPTSKITVYTDDANRVIPETEEGAQKKEIDQFAMGALAGFEMALDDMKANGWKGFNLHDHVWIKCVEMQAASQHGYSDMPLFEVSVEA